MSSARLSASPIAGTAFAALAGLVFGAGLILSGMTQPSKVQGFLDFTGSWDPTLLLVMAGAVAVHFVLFRVVRRRPSPLFDGEFHLPKRSDIDLKLVAGAAIFGVGWGLGGFCPGPGLVSLGSGLGEAALFVLAMGVGMTVEHRMTCAAQAKNAAPEAVPDSLDASPESLSDPEGAQA